MDPKVSLPLDYKLVDVPIGDWRGYPPELQAEGQQWAEPNFDDLCDKMKWVYENRDKANDLGKKARKYALKNFTADIAADRLIQYLTDKK
jgi:glycosyltransferase involved in cell wall biosynthesis